MVEFAYHAQPYGHHSVGYAHNVGYSHDTGLAHDQYSSVADMIDSAVDNINWG